MRDCKTMCHSTCKAEERIEEYSIFDLFKPKCVFFFFFFSQFLIYTFSCKYTCESIRSLASKKTKKNSTLEVLGGGSN